MATKKNLIEHINHKNTQFKSEDIDQSVDLIINYLTQELKANNRIEIRGFGSFSIRTRRMPRNDNKIYNTVYCRISKDITNKLNNTPAPSTLSSSHEY